MARNLLSLDSFVQYIKGVGPNVAKHLGRVGVKTVLDLLYYFPRTYEDRRNIISIAKITPGFDCLIRGKILYVSHERTKSRFSILKLLVSDSSGSISVTWFNQPYLEAIFRNNKGKDIFVSGKADFNPYNRQLEISAKDFEIIETDDDLTGIVPVYNLTEGLYQKKLRSIIKTAVDYTLDLITDPIPNVIINDLGLYNLKNAVRTLHFPDDLNIIEKARNRLVFDDFFVFQVGLLLRRSTNDEISNAVSLSIDDKFIGKFESSLPFSLTSSQKKALRDIFIDLSKTKPMNRMLQGDVGSGKTIVAIEALLAAVSCGCQGAIMAPTEILAQQHFQKMSKILKPMKLNIELLTSGIKSLKKKKTKENISKNTDIIVGTHALIEDNVVFNKLALCVIDEQHRFGVLQRAAFKSKGINPHLLVMSATPIPRSLALTLYGDLDRTIIDEMPAGRKIIITKFVYNKNKRTVYEFIRNQIKSGRQAFVVCPLIDESEKLDLAAAIKTSQILSKEVFPEFRVDLIHGKLKSEQKDSIMSDFVEKKINILVSTTVIEVGIDVSNATVMVIEHAERFGLSQLHQLRGRIGRGSDQSYCFLLGEPKSSESKERIKAMVSFTDGFKIAEIDLKLRGPGDFYGVRQSGLPPFRVADIIRDEEILRLARFEAKKVLAADPLLAGDDLKLLKQELFLKYGKFLELGALD